MQQIYRTDNKTRLTMLDTRVSLRESDTEYMADETRIVLDLTTFVNRRNSDISESQLGILSSVSFHMTAKEAQELAKQLQNVIEEFERIDSI